MERKITLGENICLKNRLVDVRVYYVSFFDLKDAILAMIFTVHNVLIYRTKTLNV
ncbi:hypothetical protein XBFM1_1720003 [Xenorhabdus bovienii str. feltiae Moldova]|uniref:Uncharacterized protein n=1 Tax=Xenorhabdus bovienii str. feltiae Moldova TaxID=1398200 RepID=A0A077NNT2_XENBV|nr:hypothetical protein XBFM1_1720003 [Xenorhabdus bovienii str. feltiae Moldova]